MTEKEFLGELLKATIDVDASERNLKQYRADNKKEPPISMVVENLGKYTKFYELSKRYFGL